MKKTLLALSSALLLTGALSSTASAQSSYYGNDRYDDRYDSQNDDRYGRYADSRYADPQQDLDRDGVADRYDRYDNLRGQNWDRDRDGMNDRYETGQTTYNDRDRDGVADRYDRYDNLRGQNWDRDRDGMNDRYETGQTTYYDRDRDGVPNRYDRYDNRRNVGRSHGQRRYQAGRYKAPRNYRYVRYNVGSRLPAGYYGNNYYVDYRPYGLSAPPRGYRWNRVGSDAYLVSVSNGLVRQVMYSLFY